MPTPTPYPHWSRLSKLLHWLVAILILAMAVLGLTMVNLPNTPTKIAIFAIHKSIGISILALVVLRLVWRLRAGAPQPIANTPKWQHRAAGLMHLALYVLLLAIPMSGWLLNSAAGFPLQWFELVNLPAIASQNDTLKEMATQAHKVMFFCLALLVLAHIAAAIYHHIFLRDATLARMLPRGWLRAPDSENP